MLKLLRQILSRHPFHPVTLVMADGETVTIENENFAALLPRMGWLYVELPSEPEPRFLNLFLIREIRTKGAAPEFE